MRKHILLLITLLATLKITAQNNENFYFSNLNLKDGLSQISVLKIFQDTKGFIWFGTRNGLNRYDGDHFGKVLWVKNYLGQLNPDNDYYRNNATKNDGNIYLNCLLYTSPSPRD